MNVAVAIITIQLEKRGRLLRISHDKHNSILICQRQLAINQPVSSSVITFIWWGEKLRIQKNIVLCSYIEFFLILALVPLFF